MKYIANNITIEAELHGAPHHPAVLLIMGLGMQLVAWPPSMIDQLVQAGFRVITFDNRDIGLSEHFPRAGKPNLLMAALKKKLGLRIHAPYSLPDMARDALGLLDTLNITSAHIVGVSMGGMIAQHLAAIAPERVLSLASIMSSSGAPRLPDAKPAVLRALLSRPKSSRLEHITAHYVKLFGIIGSPAFPVEQQLLRERIQSGIQRSHNPLGTQRQMLAIAADAQRHEVIKQIRVPTLVLHGLADVLVPPAHGRDTAARIPESQFIGIEGMGHDLAPGALAQLMPHLLNHLQPHDQ